MPFATKIPIRYWCLLWRNGIDIVPLPQRKEKESSYRETVLGAFAAGKSAFSLRWEVKMERTVERVMKNGCSAMQEPFNHILQVF